MRLSQFSDSRTYTSKVDRANVRRAHIWYSLWHCRSSISNCFGWKNTFASVLWEATVIVDTSWCLLDVQQAFLLRSFWVYKTLLFFLLAIMATFALIMFFGFFNHRLLGKLTCCYRCHLRPVYFLTFRGLLVGILVFLIFSSSSTSKGSIWRLSGKMKYRMLLPLIVNWSRLIGFFLLMVNLTFWRKVFMRMSTPFIDPTTIVPFLSSTVTVSFLSFMRNRTNFISPRNIIVKLQLDILTPCLNHSNRMDVYQIETIISCFFIYSSLSFTFLSLILFWLSVTLLRLGSLGRLCRSWSTNLSVRLFWERFRVITFYR